MFLLTLLALGAAAFTPIAWYRFETENIGIDSSPGGARPLILPPKYVQDSRVRAPSLKLFNAHPTFSRWGRRWLSVGLAPGLPFGLDVGFGFAVGSGYSRRTRRGGNPAGSKKR